MNTLTNLAGALFLYLTGCSLIWGAPLPSCPLPTQASADYFAVPGTPLAGAFLPISFGQSWILIATGNACHNAGNLLNHWSADFNAQLDGGLER